jgi:hypothetical protein
MKDLRAVLPLDARHPAAGPDGDAILLHHAVEPLSCVGVFPRKNAGAIGDEGDSRAEAGKCLDQLTPDPPRADHASRGGKAVS